MIRSALFLHLLILGAMSALTRFLTNLQPVKELPKVLFW